MRIGVDFDNTIICYDEVFCHLAKMNKLVPPDYCGSKRDLRAVVQASAEGDLAWQRLQGKAYGEYLNIAQAFAGVKDFFAACQKNNIEVFIVSHKTELGHHDEKKINLRDAARTWLKEQGFLTDFQPVMSNANLYFETTREAKIERIKALQCTHFIDDLIEVLHAPTFPPSVKRFLFQPDNTENNAYTNWVEITNAIFQS